MNTQARELFFFRQGATLDALRELASSDELVFYCGAGVSIDRTDVSWPQLVESVFRMVQARRNSSKTMAQSIDYLLQHLDDPRQRASIVVEQYSTPTQSDNDFLASKLKDILYEKNGWNEGYILRNLIQASFVAALGGRRVVIITTNYDTFIESGFSTRREFLARGLAPERLPGLVRRVYTGDSFENVLVHESGELAGDVEVIYLHGRVDPVGAVEGNIVLTEASYAESRDRSVQVLMEQFQGKSRGVLVVGASLTDEPLIHALALTKGEAGNRYALLSTPRELNVIDPRFAPADGSASLVTPKSVGEALELRGKHLGLGVLRPLGYTQSAQFLEELRVSVDSRNAADDTFYADDSNNVNYAARLKIWHSTWAKRKLTRDPKRTYEVLHEGLEQIRLDLKEKAESGERFRVELWARKDPRSNNRVLTLWGNSTGPILDKSMYRTEPISSDSGNASIRAFLAGRPLLMSLDTLGFPDEASRWKTFLSVPIFVQVSTVVAGNDVQSYVPAGVITLTSDRRLSGESDQLSVFADGGPDIPTLRGVKEVLIGMGRETLRPND
ncbi:SIR2 family protein [uncultured Leifsonia sp.]|uniref:SIR2 family protein n=1 Tax=uncultured Leifsonia sp. TaxID=340359 RepID=UPI0028D6A6DB|nr:SIR2 family protein [uncultured Leifsonia sp.]